jgi:ethanolamine transporter EutH
MDSRAVAFACVLTRHAPVAFRGLLVSAAVTGACMGESWAFHRYGLFRMPNLIYVLIPAGVILACVLVYLACTSLRGFLVFGTIIAALSAVGWVFSRLTPFAGLLLVGWFILRGLRANPGGGSLFKAFVVHSAIPDVSVGEAYMASESDLI